MYIIRCDRCRREGDASSMHLVAIAVDYKPHAEKHFCLPRDGMDVGCYQRTINAINNALNDRSPLG